MLLNEYFDLFRKSIEKIENVGYADSIEIREEIRANKQAVLYAKVILIDNSVLHIKEYIDAGFDPKMDRLRTNLAWFYVVCFIMSNS